MSDTFITNPSELDEPKSVAVAASMVAAGESPVEPAAPVDYFAQVPDVQTFLPDKVQWVSHKVFMEGDRKRYLKSVRRDMKIQKGTQDVIMRLSDGEERSALLSVAITGWSLIREGKPFAYSEANKRWFLDNAPVHILELIEREVRKNNPWLMADATVEDIDEQIRELEELREQIQARDLGKDDSVS